MSLKTPPTQNLSHTLQFDLFVQTTQMSIKSFTLTSNFPTVIYLSWIETQTMHNQVINYIHYDIKIIVFWKLDYCGFSCVEIILNLSIRFPFGIFFASLFSFQSDRLHFFTYRSKVRSNDKSIRYLIWGYGCMNLLLL